MELYTLDPLLRRQEVIDRFESLIWTERYQAYGDFELETPSNQGNRTRLKVGTKLAMNESLRVMQIETIEDATDSDGRKMLTIKGRSLEAILYDRTARENLTANLTTLPKWVMDGPPALLMRDIVWRTCLQGWPNPATDTIPFLEEGTFVENSTIPEPVDPIRIELDPVSVYEAIVGIAEIWNLGFRILREYDTSKLWFDVYTGHDRTASQAVHAPVIFTQSLDNLQNTKELLSIENAKNVAYVFSMAGVQVVYAAEVDPDIEGFERRIITVNASDIEAGDPNAVALMNQRGAEELAKHRTIQAFDGEISQNSQYKYGRDYNLGDIAEMRNVDGVTNIMRITEQIFVSDREGDRSYPTLTQNLFINTGSWLSWLNKVQWVELTTEEWATQP